MAEISNGSRGDFQPILYTQQIDRLWRFGFQILETLFGETNQTEELSVRKLNSFKAFLKAWDHLERCQ